MSLNLPVEARAYVLHHTGVQFNIRLNMYMHNFGFYLIMVIFGLISWLVGSRLRSRFREYSAIPLRSGLSGKEVAEKMLRDNGIYDVKVMSVEGQLTDHYNPLTKTVNLSPGVYSGRSVASAAVAAHECGHAVQHAQAYSWLQLRSALVPVISFSSNFITIMLIIGIILVQFSIVPLAIGVGLLAVTTLFSLITLPVEFDATRRGLAWLDAVHLTSGEEHEKAANALKWAATTYVVAALGSIATLMYYVMILLGGRRNH
jgi:Zn-dependent membrane protease YugP